MRWIASRELTATTNNLYCHPHASDRDLDATGQVQVKAFQDDKSRCPVERLARERGHQLQRTETGLL